MAVDTLIVEDHAGSARLTIRLLPSDFTVHWARTRRQGIAALADGSRTFHLALIDVALGSEATGGLDVLDAAVGHPRLVRALVTGSSDRSVTNHAAACGAYLIGKPFAEEQLAPLVAAARTCGDPIAEVIQRRGLGWGLTPRHLDVLRLLVEGRPRGEIASALGMAHNTFRAHVSELLARTGHLGVDAIVIALLRDALAASRPR